VACKANPSISLMILSGLLLYPGSSVASPCANDSHAQMSALISSSAECQPRNAIIALNASSFIRVFPSHVRLKRCQGGCAGLSAVRCDPDKMRTVQVPILATKCDPKGDCSEECLQFDEVEHVSCICGCLLDEEQCRRHGKVVKYVLTSH